MIRIIEEDKDLELFVSEGESDIAVPFEIAKDACGDVAVTVYPSIRPVAEEFCTLFEEDPFSVKAEAFLQEHLTSLMDEWGYGYDPKASEVIALCKAVESAKAEEETAVLLEPGQEFPSLLTFQPCAEEGDPLSACAVVVADGKIVSAAQINDLSYEEDLPEINVETAVAYRGHGYAASATRVLTAEMLKYYPGVLYAFRKRNEASAAVAEKAGFHKIGERRSFVCYRKD